MSKKSAKVGDSVEVKEGAQVERPDGSVHTIGGGTYLLDVPGTHLVDGEEYEVKAPAKK